MSRYRKSSHVVFQFHHHFVFITKYRKPVLRGDIAYRLRDLIREICTSYDIHIVQGHVRPDHVHLLLSLPPHLSPSKAMNAIKGKSSHHMLRDFHRLRKECWGQHLWARGYFGCSSGNVTDEVVKEYIEKQDVSGKQDDFKVSE